MGDLFDEKNVRPMLIAQRQEPFDSEDYIFEIKFDGHRSIAYLDGQTDLRNKKGVSQLNWLPELSSIHEQVNEKCILDGEVVVLKDGNPDFYELQRRALLKDSFKIQRVSSKIPVTFIAFDILYYKDRSVLDMPVIERKQLLYDTLKENSRIIYSRHIETYGVQMFNLVKEKGLEGIVAKCKDSKYIMGKRSKDWIKCKIINSIDCVICGYIIKESDMSTIVIGQYDGDRLVYKGHVTLGVGVRRLFKHGFTAIDYSPFGYVPRGNDNTNWIKPDIVCTIEYMPRDNGSLRQPVFKDIRDDKLPEECQIDEEER
jgi:DNA ligase D-like protein (predicted ligase)